VTPHHHLPPHHLVTHGVVLGMTGSGKTGLVIVAVEEALRAQVPVIMIDVKGDLPKPAARVPVVRGGGVRALGERESSPEEAPAPDLAQRLAAERQRELGAWGLSAGALEQFGASTALRVLTPGSTAGEGVHILSSLERRNAAWDVDAKASRAALSAAISLVLRLLGKDPDPSRSREHVLLSVLAERRMQQGHTAELGSLLDEVLQPPVERIGALDVDDFLPERDRRGLAAALNTLLASPTFASWRQGVSLDVREWLTPKRGRTPPSSSASPTSTTRSARSCSASCSKRSSPTPAACPAPAARAPSSSSTRATACSRPTRQPAHQAPRRRADKAMPRLRRRRHRRHPEPHGPRLPHPLQRGLLARRAPADRRRPQRVVDSLANANEPGSTAAELSALIRKLGPRWFLVRDVHATPNTILLQPRWALSYLRGPMTLGDIRRAVRPPPTAIASGAQ
jgi:uncharacterized protein DUF87